MIGELLLCMSVITGCGSDVPGVSVPTLPDTTIFTPPASIDASGAADVTQQLNAFFSSLPDGATVELPAGALYRIEGVLVMENMNGLTIQGNGASFFASTDGSSVAPPPGLGHKWPRGRHHVFFHGGSDIAIQDLNIKGANPQAGSAQGAYKAAFEGQHGFKFSGVQGVTLERVKVTDTYGDFLYFGAKSGEPTRNVSVRESHFERSGRQGIAITSAESVVIEGSFIGEVGRSIIDIEPNSASGRAINVVFRDNTFGPCRHFLLTAGGHGDDVREIELSNNTAVGMQLKVLIRAPAGLRRGPVRIIGNESDTILKSYSMRFVGIDGILVEGNIQPMLGSRKVTAVKASESCDVVVRDNVFQDAAQVTEIVPHACPEG